MSGDVDDSFTQLVTDDGTIVYGTGGGAPGRTYPAAESESFSTFDDVEPSGLRWESGRVQAVPI